MPDRPDARPGARATLDTPFGPFTVVGDAARGGPPAGGAGGDGQ